MIEEGQPPKTISASSLETQKEEDFHEIITLINQELGSRAAGINDSEILARAVKTGKGAVVRLASQILRLSNDDPSKGARLVDVRYVIAYFELPEKEQDYLKIKLAGFNDAETLVKGSHGIEAVLRSIDEVQVEEKSERDRSEVEKEFEAEFHHPMSEIDKPKV